MKKNKLGPIKITNLIRDVFSFFTDTLIPSTQARLEPRSIGKLLTLKRSAAPQKRTIGGGQTRSPRNMFRVITYRARAARDQMMNSWKVSETRGSLAQYGHNEYHFFFALARVANARRVLLYRDTLTHI